MTTTIIAAVSQNGTIGHNGTIPWDLPEDRAHFARTTRGGVVIMGRKTWESIQPHGLPGRVVIVLTRSGALRCAPHIASGLESAIDQARVFWKCLPVYIAGGAEVYADALPIADAFILSRICQPYEGDTRFPDWRRFVEHDPSDYWDLELVKWQTGVFAPIPWRIEHWRRDVVHG